MFRRLLNIRSIGILIFLLLSLVITESSETFSTMAVQNNYNEFYYLNSFNASFSASLNSSEIVRGVDNLLIYFQFEYENGSFIPDATIKYNITNPSHNLVYERKLIVNTTEIFNETVIWSTFNSQPEGIYNLTALANSTSTEVYIRYVSFNLIILPTGIVRMYFPINPTYLTRGTMNEVDYIITNVGGSTVTNVSISTIETSGTIGSVNTFINSTELILIEGQSYPDKIGFNPETYLYKKFSFTFSYRTIDEPSVQILGSSDHLEVIVMPDIVVNNVNLPNNATVGETCEIQYTITNNENEVLRVVPFVESTNIDFEESGLPYSVLIVSGNNDLRLLGEPHTQGTTSLRFWIDLEWITISETKWYSNLQSTIFTFINVFPEDDISPPFDPVIIYALIITSLFVGIAYFSRDIVQGIAQRARDSVPRTYPVTNYALETAVLDGSNIAWEEKSFSEKPKISNIETMINRLSKANFRKIITVADAALRYQIDDQRRLDKLVKEGAIKMLPARVDGDKFILRLAEEENGMIVSNDMFKEFREMAPWIDQRRIPYTILDGEVYLHPTAVETIVLDTEEVANNDSNDNTQTKKKNEN
jgi:hypothetical protein